MASNKRYKLGYLPHELDYKRGKNGELKKHAIKPNNNDGCPCGKTEDKIFTDEFGVEHTIPVRVKYKKCCKGKKIFYPKDEH